MTGLAWVKSSLSFANGNCLEVSELPGGDIAVRNSREPGKGILRFTPGEWQAFIGGVQNGEFDRFGAAVVVAVSKVPSPAGTDMTRVSAEWPEGDGGEWLVRMRGDDFHAAAALSGRPRFSWTGYLAPGSYSLHVEGYAPAPFEVAR